MLDDLLQAIKPELLGKVVAPSDTGAVQALKIQLDSFIGIIIVGKLILIENHPFGFFVFPKKLGFNSKEIKKKLQTLSNNFLNFHPNMTFPSMDKKIKRVPFERHKIE